MPSPSNLPLSFNRDRAARQLDARLEELLEKLRKNRPSEDPWMVRRAYEIATERHHDQFRSSGDPYLSHLLEVAHILADMRLDATTLTAAILHDAIEDTEYPVSRIEERFGAEVAHLAPLGHGRGTRRARGPGVSLSRAGSFLRLAKRNQRQGAQPQKISRGSSGYYPDQARRGRHSR